MRTHRSRADEICLNIEMRKARLNDHEAFWRAERKTRRIVHPGSFTSSVATVQSKQRTLRGAWRKAKELVMVEAARDSVDRPLHRNGEDISRISASGRDDTPNAIECGVNEWDRRSPLR